MANPEHLAKLNEGVDAWNEWRQANPHLRPNLRSSNISGLELISINLEETDASESKFINCKIMASNLNRTNLERANLSGANLAGSEMISTNLRGARLPEANLSGVVLIAANLSNSKMSGANLNGANVSSADLTGTVLSNARMQAIKLDEAVLTDAHLWETQRASWSIKGVICERIYWDQKAETPTEYAPGEFERLHSEQPSIQLFYQGDISTFELNTLPALLYRLASKHPDANIRLKTIEATSGGTTVSVSVGDVDDATKAGIKSSAAELLQAQLALRNDDVRRLQFEKDFFQTRLDSITNALIAAAAPQIHFHAPVHTAALPSGSVEIHQTFNDNSALIALFDKLLIRNTELTAAQSSEVAEATSELKKPNPDKSRLSSFYDFLKSLPKEAILKGAGKLGERAAEADWSSLLHQLGEFIHHLS